MTIHRPCCGQSLGPFFKQRNTKEIVFSCFKNIRVWNNWTDSEELDHAAHESRFSSRNCCAYKLRQLPSSTEEQATNFSPLISHSKYRFVVEYFFKWYCSNVLSGKVFNLQPAYNLKSCKKTVLNFFLLLWFYWGNVFSCSRPTIQYSDEFRRLRPIREREGPCDVKFVIDPCPWSSPPPKICDRAHFSHLLHMRWKSKLNAYFMSIHSLYSPPVVMVNHGYHLSLAY